MKTKITILSLTVIAVMMTSIGCKKEKTPAPAPTPSSKTWTVQYTLTHLNAGAYTVTYIQKGTTYTVNNAPNGWTISFNGTTGDYCSLSCSMPYVSNNDACVEIKYNGTILSNDCKFYPAITTSTSGTLP